MYHYLPLQPDGCHRLLALPFLQLIDAVSCEFELGSGTFPLDVGGFNSPTRAHKSSNILRREGKFRTAAILMYAPDASES